VPADLVFSVGFQMLRRRGVWRRMQ
jgi:hypothetical protein